MVAVGVGVRSLKLFRTENSVSCVTEARYDVGVFVQMVVNRGYINIHVRMFLLNSCDSLRSSYEAHKTDIVAATLFPHSKGIA